MTPERWEQVDRLFHAAIELGPGGREAFLADACAGDESLRREVESLLSSHAMENSFFETPAADVAAELLGVSTFTFNPGQEIGNYRIVSHLGSGGMGEVYLADDARLNRKVAIKLLPPHFTINPERVRRFEREARTASALNHPNIVTIYEIGQSNGAHFIVTEFIDGKTLRQLVNEKPFTLSETLNVAIQVASALMGAHAAGIVHRDIKPENIMIRADGYVKILDFGLAKLTEPQIADSDLEIPTLAQSNPGLVMGTVQYMAPEQARGKKVDGRTDIWSLGVVLYELLAGRAPFTGETPSHVMVSLMEDTLPPLKGYANVPAGLDRIVKKALRKNPKERYQTAHQLMRNLKNLKRELQVEARLKGMLEAVPEKDARGVPGKDTQASASVLVGGRRKIAPTLPIVLVVMLIGGIGSFLLLSSGSSIPQGPTGSDLQIKPDLIAIPGGTLRMGSFDSMMEGPIHEVQVKAFEMDKTEVTNAEYGQFVMQTKHSPPEQWNDIKPPLGQERMPVSNVSYDDAVAFAAWRSRSDGITYRLPTEEEWEYAARNGDQNNRYPWGNIWQSERAVTLEAGVGKEQPVGTHPLGANRWGVHDLIGNVWEWTSSKASIYEGNSRQLPPQYKDWIVARGGGYTTPVHKVSGMARDWFAPDYKNPVLGFRLVKVGTST